MAITQEEISRLQPGDLVKINDIVDGFGYEENSRWRNVIGQVATVKCVCDYNHIEKREKAIKLKESNDSFFGWIARLIISLIQTLSNLTLIQQTRPIFPLCYAENDFRKIERRCAS